MKAIWKFPLSVEDRQEIEMPAGAEILTAQLQGNTLYLWAVVDDQAPKEKRTIEVFGTGQLMSSETRKYISTFQLYRLALVFHVFENIS